MLSNLLYTQRNLKLFIDSLCQQEHVPTLLHLKVNALLLFAIIIKKDEAICLHFCGGKKSGGKILSRFSIANHSPLFGNISSLQILRSRIQNEIPGSYFMSPVPEAVAAFFNNLRP